MNDALVETWHVSNRVNLLLLDELPDEALAATLSTRGGRTVGQQLVHMVENRRYHLEKQDKGLAAGLVPISRDDDADRAKIRRAFEVSADLVAAILARSPTEDRIKGFKRGVVTFMAYLIAHEAHHRGHILLTVKQSGIKRPDALKYGLWAWNQL